MTPEEAEGFGAGTSRYDSGGSLPLALTAVRNGTGAAEQVRQGWDYIRDTYGGSSQ